MKRFLALWLGVVALAFGAVSARERSDEAAKVVADPSGANTRVIVTFPARRASCDVRRVDGGVRLECRDRFAFDPPVSAVEDELLDSWRTGDDGSLLFATGAGFTSFEVFELKNPARVVIDFTGTRTLARGPGASAVPTEFPRAAPRRVIVLDPGHGGVETGAIGPSGLREKDVTLDLARRLASRLEGQGVTVVLTRDDDRLVPLDTRTAIANHNRAELFVSIHLNASKATRAYGAETFFLSPEATDDEARTLAAMENKAYSGVGAAASGAGATDGQGMDRDLELILWDLAQNQYLEESGRLAETVQREFNELVGTRDRGVRQAPFTVLMGATMPAILVEVGFVSNPEEEERLRDDAYKNRVADALARAIATFRGATP